METSLRTIFCLSLTLFIPETIASTLTQVTDFGSNPGAAKMYKYVPSNTPPKAPLVISLHGCLQDVETYSQAGWIALADEWKFYLVFPEQQPGNNPYRCWNWFQAEHTERGSGEIQSIIAMTEKMKADHDIDHSRVYVEGLSAGAWLTSVLLAAYPDIFAGGATHAGGPAYCARTERHFWDVFRWWNFYSANLNARNCMQGEDKSADEWRTLINEYGLSNYNGQWPKISIWQGDADDVVNATNQQELVEQWTAMHGTDQIFDREEKSGSEATITRRVFHNSSGEAVVETWLVPGMGHGTAIDKNPAKPCGSESDYVIDVGICAVRHIGKFWKLDNKIL